MKRLNNHSSPEGKRGGGLGAYLLAGACLAILPLFLIGCGSNPPSSGAPLSYASLDSEAAVFWDRQTTESAKLLREFADQFNEQWQGLPIKVERAGNYSEIFRKVTASIRAGTLPAMAVSYADMTGEYISTGSVVNLDTLISDVKEGLSRDVLDDFVPGVLEANRFPEHGNALYSFPFAQSVLVLFFNRQVMRQAGIDEPPQTWDEFLDQCRRIRQATGKYAHAVHADCSTINGMIFSHGGDVLKERETLYDSPEALEVFRIFETLAREELAYLISPSSYEDNVALSKGDIAFVLRTSAGFSDMMTLMEGDRERWGVAPIPQKDPAKPATVIYGPNVCVFNTDVNHVKAAWAFIKYLTTPEVSARWSLETGYLPVRKSALNHPEMLRFWETWKYNRVPYDCLAFARSEPNITGWQQVRDLAARAVTEIMTGVSDAETVSVSLKHAADKALERVARDR